MSVKKTPVKKTPVKKTPVKKTERKPVGTPVLRAKEEKVGQVRLGRDKTKYVVVTAKSKDGVMTKKWKKLCPVGEVRDAKSGACRPSKAVPSKAKLAREKCRAEMKVYDPKTDSCRDRKVKPSAKAVALKKCKTEGRVLTKTVKDGKVVYGCRKPLPRGRPKKA